MTSPLPPALDVYRGQSRTGIGEGPDQPISAGYQYLGASPAVAGDGALLDAVRPWMSLDAEPADHQVLAGRLEGWSCAWVGGRLLVARLISAESFRGRSAYFSHGRLWPAAADAPLPPGFDPGLHLGRSAAFEAPFRDDDPGRRVTVPEPVMVRPEQVAAEAQTAALVLAHLLQCLTEERPLVITAPLADLVVEAPIHALVSFARGALPADLRQRCRVRVFTRTLKRFLTEVPAHLLVVPGGPDGGDLAVDALRERPDATLLNRYGATLAGGPLGPAALAYGEAVVDRAVRIPDGLTRFGERFRDRRTRPGLPADEDLRTLKLTYNLAVALGGSEAERGHLLQHYLPRVAESLGPGFDWPAVLTAAEWQAFPAGRLRELLLQVGLSAAERGLQDAAAQAATGFGLRVDEGLDSWWDGGDPAKLRRLLELLSLRPPLVSGRAAAARTSVLPLARLRAEAPAAPSALAVTGLAQVLEAELAADLLGRRAAESAELGALASAPQVFDVLCRAVMRGVLDPGWARAYLESQPAPAWPEAAGRFLRLPHFAAGGGPWQDLPRQLFATLHTMLADARRREAREGLLPASSPALDSLALLAPAALAAGAELDPAADLRTYLHLAELAETGGGNALIRRLLAGGLARLEGPTDRQLLVDAALDPAWECLRPADLAAGGELRQGWLLDVADRLIESAELTAALETSALLRLGSALGGESGLDRLGELLDDRMKRDGEAATAALLAEGWWLAWRRGSRLGPDELAEAAWEWMSAATAREAQGEGAVRLEEWQTVLADLPPSLTSVEAGRLRQAAGRRAGGRAWPWIVPFEEDQLTALAGRAADLGTLAELAEAVGDDERMVALGVPAHRYLLARSRFAGELPADALAWLTAQPQTPPEPLDLASARTLLSRSANRRERALAACARSAVAAAAQAARGGSAIADLLAAADDFSLWAQPDFLAALARWMARHESLAELGPETASAIDRRIQGEAAQAPAKVPRRLVEQLTRKGFARAARLLSAREHDLAVQRALTDEVLRALAGGWGEDPCWPRLAAAVDRHGAGGPDAGEHPLSALAARLDGLPRRERLACQTHGWPALATAATRYPALIGWRAGGGLPLFDLAASLAGPGGLGNAALRIVFLPQEGEPRMRPEWWAALLDGLNTWPGGAEESQAENREDVALALVAANLDQLVAAEQRAFWAALRGTGARYPQWQLPKEFGMVER